MSPPLAYLRRGGGRGQGGCGLKWAGQCLDAWMQVFDAGGARRATQCSSKVAAAPAAAAHLKRRRAALVALGRLWPSKAGMGGGSCTTFSPGAGAGRSSWAVRRLRRGSHSAQGRAGGRRAAAASSMRQGMNAMRPRSSAHRRGCAPRLTHVLAAHAALGAQAAVGAVGHGGRLQRALQVRLEPELGDACAGWWWAGWIGWGPVPAGTLRACRRRGAARPVRGRAARLLRQRLPGCCPCSNASCCSAASCSAASPPVSMWSQGSGMSSRASAISPLSSRPLPPPPCLRYLRPATGGGQVSAARQRSCLHHCPLQDWSSSSSSCCSSSASCRRRPPLVAQRLQHVPLAVVHLPVLPGQPALLYGLRTVGQGGGAGRRRSRHGTGHRRRLLPPALALLGPCRPQQPAPSAQRPAPTCDQVAAARCSLSHQASLSAPSSQARRMTAPMRLSPRPMKSSMPLMVVDV
jgi:hypothetical protein